MRRDTASASELGITPAEYARVTRQIPPELWKHGTALAEQYRLVIERDEYGDGYIGCTVEMPSVFGGGDDLAMCVADTLEATAFSIAVMLESGQTPPAPAREGKRDQQINIRLTAEEKLNLEGLAARDGFRSVSDYVRSAALRRPA